MASRSKKRKPSVVYYSDEDENDENCSPNIEALFSQPKRSRRNSDASPALSVAEPDSPPPMSPLPPPHRRSSSVSLPERSQPPQHMRRTMSVSAIDELKEESPNPFDIEYDVPEFQSRNVPEEIFKYFCEDPDDGGGGGVWRTILHMLSSARRDDESFPMFYTRQKDELTAKFHDPESNLFNPRQAVDIIDNISTVLYALVGGDFTCDTSLHCVEIANRLLGASIVTSPPEADIPCRLLKSYAGGMLNIIDRIWSSPTVDIDLRNVPERRIDAIKDRLIKFHSRVDAIGRMKRAMLDLHMTTSPEYGFLLAPDIGIFSEFDLDNITEKFQRALITVMRAARAHHLRRIGTDLYEPHYITYDGRRVPTHYYNKYSRIDEFIGGTVCNYESGPMFKDVMMPTSLGNLTKWMEVSNTSDLPVLLRDRHVFSFRNGVFNALAGTDPPRWDFYEYRNISNARCGLISCNFIDQDVDPAWTQLPYNFFPGGERCKHDADIRSDVEDDWMTAIPTPSLDRIFLYQWPESPEEQAQLKSAERTIDPKILRRFSYAMLGRLIYDVNELDTWQVSV